MKNKIISKEMKNKNFSKEMKNKNFSKEIKNKESISKEIIRKNPNSEKRKNEDTSGI